MLQWALDLDLLRDLGDGTLEELSPALLSPPATRRGRRSSSMSASCST
ncbi:hypothetical protein [Nocardioides nanhaiensis]